MKNKATLKPNLDECRDRIFTIKGAKALAETTRGFS
jgi:hypothetical protein